MATNVFVVGLDDLNEQSLRRLPGADELSFHRLLTIDELQLGDEIPIADLVETATRQLRSFDGRVDAIVGYWDFPVSCMLPILCARFGLPSTSLESRLRCEHKYWSRLEQQKVIEDTVAFEVVDPFDDAALGGLGLDFPFWLKPVKAFSSELAYRVADEPSFAEALAGIRDGIDRIGDPFGWVLEQVPLPPEVAAAGPKSCLAEEAMSGHQATVEGYSLDGQVDVYGVVDTLYYPGSLSFQRYEYPSRLPDGVQARMADLSARVVRQVGVDRSTFNIEFFWDPASDRVRLLEINTRHSQSHALLFEAVDGMANHAFMIALALGRPLPVLRGDGPAGCAAKWFLRRFDDGVVTRCPTHEEVAAIERAVPGTTIELQVGHGTRLSDLHDQDAYSYKLAEIFVHAADRDELVARYEECVDGLHFQFADATGRVDDAPGRLHDAPGGLNDPTGRS